MIRFPRPQSLRTRSRTGGWRTPLLTAAVGAALLAPAASFARGGALPFEPFTAEAYESALRGGKPFVVEFSADWCTPCKEMAERTFTDPRVLEQAHDFKFLTVDMTEPTRMTELILESFRVVGAPTTLFFAANGKEHDRRIGFIGPDDFLELLSETRAAAKPKPPRAGFSGRGV
jgi:thiol:disulfide interchange protein DsbD